MLSDDLATVSMKLVDGKPTDFVWHGKPDVLLAISPELVEWGTIEQLPWKLEFVRDEEVPGTSKDGKGLVLRKLYRRLDTL